MTSTLLLRLAAPRQSWGGESTQRWRTTERIPTRTGVEGMLRACLGLPHGEDAPYLHDLRLVVRVDRAGIVGEDFHTISPPPPDVAASRARYVALAHPKGVAHTDSVVPLGNGKPWLVAGSVQTMVTRRLHLEDAEFILAIEGVDNLIAGLSDATLNPVFSPYLGRAAFAPTFPFHLGVVDTEALEGLATLPTTSTLPALPVHEIGAHQTRALPRLTPPRTDDPFTAWVSFFPEAR